MHLLVSEGQRSEALMTGWGHVHEIEEGEVVVVVEV